jgi:hypothetical protein
LSKWIKSSRPEHRPDRVGRRPQVINAERIKNIIRITIITARNQLSATPKSNPGLPRRCDIAVRGAGHLRPIIVELQFIPDDFKLYNRAISRSGK